MISTTKVTQKHDGKDTSVASPLPIDIEGTRFLSLMQELVEEQKKTNLLLELIYGEEVR